MSSPPWAAVRYALAWIAFSLWPVWLALLARALARPSARRRRVWREAAKRVGLTRVEASRDGVVGWAGPVHVGISLRSEGSFYATGVTVGGAGLPAGLSVRSEESVDPRVRGALREVEVGDLEFDGVAWVEGSPAVAHAVLDRSTRRALQALCEGRLEVPGHSPVRARGRLENGILEIEVRRGAGVDRLAEVLEHAIALGRLLASPAEVPRRVADNLKHERLARVRLASLAALVREYPDDPATREALLEAREDPDPEVRLRAGVALGPQGRDVLRAIAGSRGIEDDTASRAVAALEADLAVDEAAGLLRAALGARRPATARACMAALGRRGGADAIEVLAEVLATETGPLGAAAAAALAMTGGAAAEGPLLRALAEGSRDVRLAAAKALGGVGTAAAVAPLREAEEGDAGMRRAARQAVAEIQARLTGAEPGQLSLAGGEAGALSLAGSEAGSLSLVDEEAAPARSVSGPAAGLASSGARSAERAG
jgi:HEAT repeat protein